MQWGYHLNGTVSGHPALLMLFAEEGAYRPIYGKARRYRSIWHRRIYMVVVTAMTFSRILVAFPVIDLSVEHVHCGIDWRARIAARAQRLHWDDLFCSFDRLTQFESLVTRHLLPPAPPSDTGGGGTEHARE